MTVALSAIQARPAHALSAWQVQRVTQLKDFLRDCAAVESASAEPFQHTSWLRTWYETIARQPGVEPLLLSARRAGDPQALMLFALVRRKVGRLVQVEWADLGVTDYNGPIARDGLCLDDQDARGLWKALRAALPRCDLMHLDKMRAEIGRVPNPLVHALRAVRSDLFGNPFRLHDEYADWLNHLGKHARKEFARHWRIFSRHPQARFVRASTVDEGLDLLRRLALLQNQRRAADPYYRLHQRAYTDFYERYLQEHLASGRCVMTALMAGDELVAGLFSVYDGRRLTMLRMAIAGEAWKPCAPGKLVLERTIAHLHEQGCREFDLAIGDYTHKKVFQTTPLTLHEACVALSLRGLPRQIAWRLKHEVRQRPRLRAAAVQVKQRLRALSARTKAPAAQA